MIARNNKDDQDEPEKNVGLGGHCPSDEYPVIGREERLLARAAKWNVKPEWREAILARQVKTAINPQSTPRDAARAAKFVLDADKFEEDRQSPKGTTIAIQNNVTTGDPAVTANRSEVLRHVLNSSPDYLDYVRNRSLADDSNPGPLREDGERGTLEDGEASRGA